jgi:hypothetical protein
MSLYDDCQAADDDLTVATPLIIAETVAPFVKCVLFSFRYNMLLETRTMVLELDYDER